MYTMLKNRQRPAVVHGSLKSERRRHVLYRLKNRERPQALADLAEYVAGRESETPGPEMDRETVKSVYVDLYHCHVPKLADGGFVEYDQEADTVALVEYPEDSIDEATLVTR